MHLALAFTSVSKSSLPPAPSSVASVPARRTRSSGVHGIRRSSVAGHLHPELPAVKERSVHGVHGVLGVSLIQKANEGEASALLRVPVPGDVHVPDAPVLLEHSSQGLRWGSVGEVVHFKRGHPLDVRRRPSVVHLLRLGDSTSEVEPNKTATNKIPAFVTSFKVDYWLTTFGKQFTEFTESRYAFHAARSTIPSREMAAIELPLQLLQGPRHPLLIGHQVCRLPVVTAPWCHGVLSRLNRITAFWRFTEICTKQVFGRFHITYEYVPTDFVANRKFAFSFSPVKSHGTVIFCVSTRHNHKNDDNANDDNYDYKFNSYSSRFFFNAIFEPSLSSFGLWALRLLEWWVCVSALCTADTACHWHCCWCRKVTLQSDSEDSLRKKNPARICARLTSCGATGHSDRIQPQQKKANKQKKLPAAINKKRGVLDA